MLALFPEIEESTLSKEVLGELPEMVAAVIEEEPWTLYFDGSSTSKGGGAGVVLINPDGHATALSFKLDFPCTNNVTEYEAFIMGLSTAKEMGAERMKVIGDSILVLSQLQGSFAVKEVTLAPYQTAAERLINSFKQIVMEHIPGVTNSNKEGHTDSRSNGLGGAAGRRRLEKKLGEESGIKDLKDYVIIFGELYRCLPGGVLTRCIGIIEARRRLQEVHDATCSLEPVISLYRRLQCKGTQPSNSKLAYELKKTVKRYFVDGSTLYQKGFNGEPLR
ncbi:unnamed protein product [Prunus armeniaca]